MTVVLICGDRNWTNFPLIENVIKSYPKEITEFVEGDSRGADKIAGYLCRQLGYKVTPEPARWDLYSHKAGPIRNRLMLKKYNPDVVLAFHNDIKHSKGTKDMIKAALKAGKRVVLFSVGSDPVYMNPLQQKLLNFP